MKCYLDYEKEIPDRIIRNQTFHQKQKAQEEFSKKHVQKVVKNMQQRYIQIKYGKAKMDLQDQFSIKTPMQYMITPKMSSICLSKSSSVQNLQTRKSISTISSATILNRFINQERDNRKFRYTIFTDNQATKKEQPIQQQQKVLNTQTKEKNPLNLNLTQSPSVKKKNQKLIPGDTTKSTLPNIQKQIQIKDTQEVEKKIYSQKSKRFLWKRLMKIELTRQNKEEDLTLNENQIVRTESSRLRFYKQLHQWKENQLQTSPSFINFNQIIIQRIIKQTIKQVRRKSFESNKSTWFKYFFQKQFRRSYSLPGTDLDVNKLENSSSLKKAIQQKKQAFQKEKKINKIFKQVKLDEDNQNQEQQSNWLRTAQIKKIIMQRAKEANSRLQKRINQKNHLDLLNRTFHQMTKEQEKQNNEEDGFIKEVMLNQEIETLLKDNQ